MKFRKAISCILVMLLFLTLLPIAALAQTQQGPDPIVLNPEREKDNLEQIPAAAAARPDAVTIFNAGSPKYFWINNFGGRSTDYLEWEVQSNLAETTDYYAWLHISANSGTEFKITVTQNETSTSTSYTKESNGWEVADFGIIKIPTGVSKIRLEKVTAADQNCSIKGIDIIRESDWAAYLNRVNSYRASGEAQRKKFATSKYGLFYQYGVWGYPESGDKKSMEDATNDFNVDDFVDLQKTVGAKFVIWSLTWWQYRMQMPVKAVDDIMGNSSLTTERDLVKEIADKCKAAGIDFYLYYHQGLQQEPAWKAKQNWPDNTYTNYGTGDRSTFFKNWESVVSEVGTTLGESLDGWFFDDGCVYYPAPFEELANAAKTGNAGRLISFNAWQGTKVTEFQDTIFGEGGWGTDTNISDGIYTSGKEKGLQQIGMPMINNGNWGITSANESIDLTVPESTIINNVKSAAKRNVPVAINIKMWEDGKIGDTTLAALLNLNSAVNGAEQPLPETYVNNDDAGITYSEGWTQTGQIYSENYNSDIALSTTVSSNPSLSYTFTGTGIDVIGNRASWSASADVSIVDSNGTAVATGTADFTNSNEAKPYTAYSKTDLEKGTYTITVTYKSPGAEAHFDAFKVYDNTIEPPTQPIYSVKSVDVTSPKTVVGFGEQVQFSTNVHPQYATEKGVTWSVTDEDGKATDIASIDANGLLTAGNFSGDAVIKAVSKADPSIKGEKAITVKKLNPTTTVPGNDDSIDRTGTWSLRNNTKACDTDTPGAELEYTFTGNRIEWYGVKADDHGIAMVYIDGTPVQTVDCYDATRQTNVSVFRSDLLKQGQHKIKIVVQQDANALSSGHYIEVYKFMVESEALKAKSIEITQPFTKRTYKKGDELDVSGGRVKVIYSDDSESEGLISNSMVSGYDKDKTGEQTLTITHEGLTATCKIIVLQSVTGIALNKTATTLDRGAAEALTAAIAPADATNTAVSWTSSDTAVAVVDAAGKVTAIAKGTAVITATTADGGLTATCTVTVTDTVADKAAADKAAADAVAAKINAIGAVTVNSKAAIDAAQAAYNALTPEQKALVTNAGALTAAETAYAQAASATATSDTTPFTGSGSVSPAVEKTLTANSKPTLTAKDDPELSMPKSERNKPKICITWNKRPNVSGYELQLSTKKKSGFKTIRVINHASYGKMVKGGLVAGKTYYYRTRWFRKNADGTKSFGKWSGATKAKAVSAKSGILATSWWRAKNAIKYQVQVSEKKAAGYKTVTTTKNTSFAAYGKYKNGKSYYVRYRARVKVNGRYVWTKWSAPFLRKAK